MINLLPPNDRRQLEAARTNTLLLRYSSLLGLFICLLILELIAVFFVMNIGKTQNEAEIRDNEVKTQAYASTKEQAATFSANLAAAKYILSKQIPYSAIILTIANNLPAGAVVDKLSIDPATFGTPTTMTIRTVSYDKAIAVKSALQSAKLGGKTPVFTSISFQSVAQGDAQSSHPFIAIYNVTYSKELLTQ